MEKFSDRLTRKRKEKRLSQQEVADLLGKSRQAYAHYESGRMEPSHDALVKLSELLECSTDYLLKGTSADDLSTGKKMENDEKEYYQKQIDTLLQTINIMSGKLVGKRKGASTSSALATSLNGQTLILGSDARRVPVHKGY